MYTELIQTLNSHDNFAVISHFRPDGDAIGSTLAMGLLLQSLGKKVQMWNTDSVPQRYAFLSGAELIRPVPATLPAEVQVLICVDTGDLKRIGTEAMELFTQAPFTINIDHHHTNTRYAQLNIVEGSAAACGCILHKIIRAAGVQLTRPMAEALYAALHVLPEAKVGFIHLPYLPEQTSTKFSLPLEKQVLAMQLALNVQAGVMKDSAEIADVCGEFDRLTD